MFKDEYIELYNCDCNLYKESETVFDMVFADPPFGLDLTIFEKMLMGKCSGHVFLMTNERVLIPFSNKFLDKFVRMYAINTVVPNMISSKAPMQLADFVSEFRFGKTRFFNQNECFSNLIDSRKVRNKKHYSKNFDKEGAIYAFFIKHFTKEGDIILDPFGGSCKVALVARKLKRKIIIFEIDKDSAKYARDSMLQTEMLL